MFQAGLNSIENNTSPFLHFVSKASHVVHWTRGPQLTPVGLPSLPIWHTCPFCPLLIADCVRTALVVLYCVLSYLSLHIGSASFEYFCSVPSSTFLRYSLYFSLISSFISWDSIFKYLFPSSIDHKYYVILFDYFSYFFYSSYWCSLSIFKFSLSIFIIT